MTLAEFTSADVEVIAVSRVAMLFLIVCVGLIALLVGLLVITRLRRRLRSLPVEDKESAQADPWKESANRVEVDPNEPDIEDSLN